jgi:hypothetical protein
LTDCVDVHLIASLFLYDFFHKRFFDEIFTRVWG